MKSLSAIALLALGAAACAQPSPSSEPPMSSSRAITTSIESTYGIAKGYLTQSAAQTSDELYAFKATAEVRSLGAILAHVADANYMFCSTASGEAAPAESVEQTKTTKADIQQALAASFAVCDRAFAGLDDASGAGEVTIAAMNMPTTRLGALAFASAHAFEHYGNVVTYLRLNNVVPPSSQGGGM
jgi:uncharacterized damage-inducible protein DinB